MRKIITTLLLGIVAFTFGKNVVSATVYSNIITGPDVYSGNTTYNSADTFTVSGENSIQGNKLHIKMRVVGTLVMGQTSGTRYFYVYLYEDDVYPNEDELVRTYKMSLTGRKLNCAYLTDTNHESGNIDSSGDNTVELYVGNYLPAKSGDTAVNNEELFKYQYYYGSKLSNTNLWSNCVGCS